MDGAVMELDPRQRALLVDGAGTPGNHHGRDPASRMRRRLSMARPLTWPAWPDGAEAAVSLTFDVDAESAYHGRDEFRDRLTTMSAARFSVDRGLPRILDL